MLAEAFKKRKKVKKKIYLISNLKILQIAKKLQQKTKKILKIFFNIYTGVTVLVVVTDRALLVVVKHVLIFKK